MKSRRGIAIDNHEAIDGETWNGLDHTWPLRLLFVRADDGLLVLHTPRRSDVETVTPFESIRDSVHFIPSVRR